MTLFLAPRAHSPTLEPDEKVDLAIVLLDASAMTRSLYLLGQVAQAGHPVVAVATMVDVSEKDGQKYPVDKLADELGIPFLL